MSETTNAESGFHAGHAIALHMVIEMAAECKPTGDEQADRNMRNALERAREVQRWLEPLAHAASPAVPERGEEETARLTCSCAATPPTMPVFRTRHLRSCPAFLAQLERDHAALLAEFQLRGQEILRLKSQVRARPEGEDARRLKQERDAYKLLSEGQAGLLVAYRTQSLRTPEGALRKIERAEKQLAKLSTPTRSERDGEE